MRTIRIILLVSSAVFAAACGAGEPPKKTVSPTQLPEPSPPTVADSFAYPIGENEYSTQAKDAKDAWYNVLDFGESNHLGEDWNKNSGGNTDCGEPVYAAANGRITYARNAGRAGETSSS